MSAMLNEYYAKINILDSIFAKIMDESFKLDSEFFYTSTTKASDEKLQCIASTFNIEIQMLHKSVRALALKQPLVKHFKIGTKSGIESVAKPIFGDVVIRTHANDENIAPFDFEIDISPDSRSMFDITLTQKLLDAYKPLRDSKGFVRVVFPSFEIEHFWANAGFFRYKLHKTSAFNRTIKQTHAYFLTAELMRLDMKNKHMHLKPKSKYRVLVVGDMRLNIQTKAKAPVYKKWRVVFGRGKEWDTYKRNY